MTNLQEFINLRRELAQRSAFGDLSTAVPSSGAALSLLCLKTDVFPNRAAMRLDCINMQVKRFMANLRFSGNLLGTQLQPQKLAGSLFHAGRKRAGVTTRFKEIAGKFTSQYGFVAPPPGIAAQLTTESAHGSSKPLRNLRDVVLGIHKAINLDELFATHRASSTCRSGSNEN